MRVGGMSGRSGADGGQAAACRRARRRLLVATIAITALVLPAAALAAGFDDPASNDPSQQFAPNNVQRQDTPNDPGYDRAEPDDPDGGTATSMYEERYDLFGFPSAYTRGTTFYREGPNNGQPQISGFNAAGAWKLERGRPDTVVAILDTGIEWDREGIRTQVSLNTDELPKPADDGATCAGSGLGGYDCNDDGSVDVTDWAGAAVDPGAGPNGSAQLDASDLIATYSDGDDDGGNGFVDDIAGWDFFDDDNDPYDASSYFAASGHGTGRMLEAAERGNDGQGELGVCPKCKVMPLRIWDTFVSDGNTFGMGILYAADNGAAVVEGANGSLYHSAFTEAASEYAYDQGLVQTYSGDDLNTANHNYPANYGRAMLIQGTAPDTIGLGADAGEQFRELLCGELLDPLGTCIGSQVPVGTYFRGANTTQFGGKSSLAMEGATGSENTGKAAGAAALVISAARNASPPIDLRPDETRAILEQTAERVTGGATGIDGNVAGIGAPDPGADPSAAREDQWTSHFGWGRVNLGEAVRVARSGEIPPEAAIESPDWYAPVTGGQVVVSGLARARFADAGRFDWRLEWGPGQDPVGAEWRRFAGGEDATGTVSASGTIDLAQVRAALATYEPPPDPGSPVFSTTAPHPLEREFTVRLVVTGDGIDTPGIDRRVLSSADDPTLRDGFPKRMGTGGEAPPRYADINGDNVQELILPTEDGRVHAYRPGGGELPGWPVRTELMEQARDHQAAPGFAAVGASAPPLEPPRGPTIADLEDDGRPEVITAAGTRIYAWEPDGSLREGFPVQSDLTKCAPSLQSQPLRHPKCGFIATPSVARLDGPGEPPTIVAPGLDGYLYAFDGDGRARPGFPLRLVDPAVPPNEQMLAESINEPAIGDLNGDGRDDIVVATNETYDPETPQGFSEAVAGGISGLLTELLAQAAGGSARVYAVDGASGEYLDGWPIAVDGAIQTTLPLIGPGQNPSIARIGGQPRVIASATGSATIGIYRPDGSLQRGIEQVAPGPASAADGALPFGALNLFESASVGKLSDGGSVNVVKYGLGISAAANLLLVGQNLPYNHLIGAYDAQTGVSAPSYPRVTDDFQFLSSSNVAKVEPGPSNHVIAGTGLGLLHAYDGVTGLDAEGFPKFTGGWLFAPAALSDDGRIADITREGFLFEWDHPSLPECQTEWPAFRHDQQGSGNYDRDGTQPYKPADLVLRDRGETVRFTAPGDDYGCGKVARYQAATSDSEIGPKNFAATDRLGRTPAPAEPGSRQTYELPQSHKRYVAIRAVDEAGNVGWTATIDTGKRGGGGPGPGAGQCGNKVRGTGKHDRLKGTKAGDRIRGGKGNDRIKAGNGNDCVGGEQGNDRIQGGKGRDKLKGGPGKDRISGGPGDDRIVVRTGGRDRVSCGGGKDVVAADRRRDRVAKTCEEVKQTVVP